MMDGEERHITVQQNGHIFGTLFMGKIWQDTCGSGLDIKFSMLLVGHRYLQNRLELEGQMSSRGTKKLQEDEMSRAEKAINRRYVIETYKETEGLSP